jgi:hypothetical protein
MHQTDKIRRSRLKPLCARHVTPFIQMSRSRVTQGRASFSEAAAGSAMPQVPGEVLKMCTPVLPVIDGNE